MPAFIQLILHTSEWGKCFLLICLALADTRYQETWDLLGFVRFEAGLTALSLILHFLLSPLFCNCRQSLKKGMHLCVHTSVCTYRNVYKYAELLCVLVQVCNYTCSVLKFRNAVSALSLKDVWEKYPFFFFYWFVSCLLFHFVWMSGWIETSKKNSPEHIWLLAGYFRWRLIIY